MRLLRGMRKLWLVGVPCALALPLAGCGGSGGDGHAAPISAAPAASGAAVTLTIRWPGPGGAARPRVIPDATQSIRVVITQLGQAVTTRLLPRPATSGSVAYSFVGLPVGALTATATAYPNADGSGTALARGTTRFVTVLNTGQSGGSSPITITLVVPLDHLSADASLLLVGGKAVLTAEDASGVPLPATPDLTWQSSGAAASVAAAGNPVSVRGAAVSPAVTITVTQASTGVSVRQTFRVADILGTWAGTVSYPGGGSDALTLQITQRPDDALSVFVVSPQYNNETFLQSTIGSAPGVDFSAVQTPVPLNIISGTAAGNTLTGALVNPNAIFVEPGLPRPFTVTRQ